MLAGRARDAVVFAAGVAAAAAVLALLGSASVLAPGSSSLLDGPHTFYDDLDLSYEAVGGRRLAGWDAKRTEWLRSRGLSRAPERVVMVSGSQLEPCPGDVGDHLLLRFLKNQLDYCRLHRIELLYNRDVLQPAMTGYWAKIPVVRAAMLAHSEVEWVLWVDSDAVFTDMDFSLPLAAYGWPDKIARRSWLGINAGVFLIRNCQWSLDFMDEGTHMGPAYPEHARWGEVIRGALSDKGDDAWCDDQSALVYLLLLSNWEGLGKNAYIETEATGWTSWAGLTASRRAPPGLRRRHTEREHLRYAAARNAVVRGAVPGPAGGGKEGWRRPLITHFVGCQPCSGGQNPMSANNSVPLP
ncbi:putative glycosyltransferase 6 [Panicum miliaceum]|uniref:Glycosyltransferase 6 n=1 Tax=Panicum miliaceum TaxID=4540 RepID=A0A3L6PLF1_PANMI|nr:putative glycosyltransferase 6 [Panicum miliaceum]